MPTTYAGDVRMYRFAAAAALVIQFWALYIPRAPSVGSGLPLDKVVHVGIFAAATYLGLKAGWHWIVPAMILQAGVSEMVQGYLLSARGGDWWDFVADLIGIALGWALWRVTSVTPEPT